MPKSGLSSEQLRRKFSAVTNTQDSITATSTWILRNTKHINEIMDCWDSQIAKSDHEHRLTLLYLANDVVQNCRKRDPELIDKWRGRIELVFSSLSHHSIRSGVEKVLNVWDSRSVFPKDSIEKLRKLLETAKTSHKDKAERALQEFKPSDLVEALKEYTSCENDLRLKRELLQSSGLDESDPDKLLEKVKERGQGNRARQELQQWTQLLIEYVDLQEIHIERRRKLLSLINQSCIFYQAQFHEVNVVMKAYKDYQERVLAQKKRCQEMMKTKFPSLFPNISPIQSPTQSPVQSPTGQIDMRISDDDTANSSEEEQVENTLEAFFGPSSSSSTNPNASATLPDGLVEAEGDLDSRLANIFTPEKETNDSEQDAKKRKATRWDFEEPNLDKDIAEREDSRWPEKEDSRWPEKEESNGNEAPWIDPKWPDFTDNNSWEPPGRFNSPGFNQRFPDPRFPSPRLTSPDVRFNHEFRRGAQQPGMRGGRSGFMPRTPQNFHRPSNHFNSEGSNRYSGGNFRGNRGNFSQRGPPRGMRGMRGGRW